MDQISHEPLSIDSSHTSRFFVDISGTLEHIKSRDFLSGIQRVVLTIAAQLANKLPPERLYLSWCDRDTETYRCVLYHTISEGSYILTAKELRNHFFPGIPTNRAFKLIERYHNRPLTRAYHVARYSAAARFGFERSFTKREVSIQDWKDLLKAMRSSLAPKDVGQSFAETYSPGDHLLQLDLASQPWQKKIMAAIAGFKVTKHLMIYDIIPVDAPQVVSGGSSRSFLTWLDDAVNHADAFLPISDFSHAKFKEYLEQTEREGRTTTLPLAQDRLPLPGKTYQAPEDRVSRQMIDLFPMASQLGGLGREETELFYRPFVLCVGTLEARKNIWRIAVAWKQLVETRDRGKSRELPTLVFAGATSHMPEDFRQFMEGTGGCHGYIRVIPGPSDNLLDLLYEHCLFSIQVSLAEGWGLPVGESLAYGRTALVGNGSSLPEVGGDLVEYCDPEDIDSIADGVRRLLDPAHRASLEARIKNTTLRGWSDVANDLIRIVEIDSAYLAHQSKEGQKR